MELLKYGRRAVYEMELVEAYTNLSPRGAVVACLVHAQEVDGSNPSAETRGIDSADILERYICSSFRPLLIGND